MKDKSLIQKEFEILFKIPPNTDCSLRKEKLIKNEKGKSVFFILYSL